MARMACIALPNPFSVFLLSFPLHFRLPVEAQPRSVGPSCRSLAFVVIGSWAPPDDHLS
jgi:hypothetical protein